MDYLDQVYVYCLRLKPGEKVLMSQAKDPQKLITAVKRLIDSWGLQSVVEFNADYTVLRRMNQIKIKKL